MMRRLAFGLVAVLGMLPITLLTGCGHASHAAAAAAASASSSNYSSQPMVRLLQAENTDLTKALLAQLKAADSNLDHLQALGVQVEDLLTTETASETALDRNPAIATLLRHYFAMLLQAQAPGQRGAAARVALARFFIPHATALTRVRYVALGKLATSDHAAWPEGMQTAALPTVHAITVNRARDRATVIVYPLHNYWAYADRTNVRCGQFDGQTVDAWNATMADGPHRLTLVRRAGTWLISDDFSVGGELDVAEMMKAGGAPMALWQAEARRIAARTKKRIPVPAGSRPPSSVFLSF